MTNNASLCIGNSVSNWGGYAGYFKGKLDDIRIYHRALNGNEIGQLYNTGNTFTYVPVHGDQVYCMVTSTATCATGSPATSNVKTIVVNPCQACPGVETVTHGGQQYNTVQIGTQCWFKENLNIGTRINGASPQTNNGIVEKYCYNDLETNCDVYGGLYEWNEMMQYSTVQGSQGICPLGWHVPTDNEYCILTQYIDPSVDCNVTGWNGIDAGSKLKEVGTEHWMSPNLGTNSYGFTALPGGTRSYDYLYYYLNSNAYLWTSSEASSTSSWYRGLLNNNATISRGTSYSKIDGFYVRCLKDLCPYTVTVTITIQPSANPVCLNQTVTFTALPLNGGSNPIYQWKVNGINSGTNSPDFSYAPLNNDIITCELTSNASCTTGNPATSNSILMVVYPSPIVTATANSPLCVGNTLTLMASPPGMNQYHWMGTNGFNVTTTVTNISIPSVALFDSGIYTLIATDPNGCDGTASVPVIIEEHPTLTMISGQASQNVCIYSSITDIVFNTGGSATGATVSGLPLGVSGTFLSGTLTISGTPQIPGNYTYTIVTMGSYICPAATFIGNITVSENLSVSLSVVASQNPVCFGSDVIFTATPVNGGSSPAYQWQVNGSNAGTSDPTFTYNPANGDVVTCILTSNATCATGSPATSNPVTMSVNPNQPVSVTLTASENPVCEGTCIQFDANPINAGDTPVYDWMVNSTNPFNTGSPLMNGIVAYYPFNGNANDASGNGNNGTIYGATLTNDRFGFDNSAYSFNGNGDYISIANSPSLQNSYVTVCAWIRPVQYYTGSYGGNAIVYKGNDQEIGFYGLAYVTGSQKFEFDVKISPTVVKWVQAGSIINLNQQYFVCGVFDGSNLKIYVNGTLENSISCPGVLPINTSPLSVGKMILPSYPYYVNGCIDDIRIYNRGLTDCEIAALYKERTAQFNYLPTNNDVISCVLTSNAPCATGSPATSNPLTMIVNSNLPVGVSITASENPVCQGTSVTYTASQTNGGLSPTYQWQVNGMNAGANNPTYTYTPANNDIVTCILTSNATCATGSPATSNPVAMTINANLPVSINITASENPVCQGTSVTFTAAQTNGGSSPAYQWQVNGMNAGVNNHTYSYTPLNGDVVTCILTSNATCATGSPATSNPVTMVVNENLPVSVNITASENPVCQGTSVTFTASQINGGSSPAYQWQVNGLNAGTNNPTYSYTPINGDVVTCILASNATCATGSPATSNPVTMTVNENIPVGISITASENPICQGNSVTFTASQTNGGSSPAYQWQVNGVNAGGNNPTYTYTPANNDVVICILTSNATCATGSPATSNPVTMVVNSNLPVGVSVTASENPVCQGTSVTFTATQTNGGSSPAYQWQVNGVNAGANNNTYSYTPINGDIITCILTSNATCATGSPATSNPVTMIVNSNLPVGVSITASENPVCQGTTVTFTATQINGGSSPTYQWQVNGVNAGANNNTYSYTPINGDIITCILTSNATCATGSPATSNPVTMVVNENLPVIVNITASENPVCQGTSVTFTATQTNGGSSPAYQWQVNGVNAGANNPTYTYTPANNDVITCILTSNATCATGSPATSNTITMTVNENLPVGISIIASENPVCQGTSVTFTAAQTNGGSSPAYQWQVNGVNVGVNNPTYSYTPLNGDVVTCILTSNATCATGSPATSNPVTMTVNENLPVGISITASENPVCQGTSVTFTATQTNGGSSPAYQWQVNGVNAGDNNPTYTYTPANNDVVTCILVSNATCATGSPATSNPITMSVNENLPVGISITASENPVCQGTSVTFTATQTNGGSSPAYQWQVNGVNAGANNPTYTFTPANNDVITCILTSNATCATGSPATSNPVTMTVNSNLPVGVFITASENPICQGTSVTFTATQTNGGSSPAYQWQVNGVIAGANNPTYTYTPANNDIVTCILTSNATCATGSPATSNPVTMTVNANLPVSINITASENPVCQGTSVTFTAAQTNGGSSPAYQWQVNGVNVGVNNPTYSYAPLNGDVVTCILTSNATCATGSPATSNPVTMVVNSNLPVGVSITASENPVCQGTTVTFTATQINGGSSPAYQWQVNGVNAVANNPTYTYTPANNDVVTCILTSNATCATGSPANSNPVTMTVNPNLPVGISITASDNPVCQGTSVTFTATQTNGGSLPAYQWQVNGVNAGANNNTYSYTPINGDIITCILTSNATCATGSPATSNPLTIIVNPNLPVGISITASENPVCQGTSVTFTATQTNGGSSPAYQWQVNGVNAGANNPTYTYTPANNDIVTCILTSNATCATGSPATSNPVTMIVNLNLPVGVSITASENPVCQGTSVMFTAAQTNGGSSPAYQWQVNGVNAGDNNPTYTYTPANNDIVTCILTSNATCATGSPATSNPITITVNPNLPVSINITASENPVCQGTSVTFTASQTNGGSSPAYQWQVNGVNAGDNNPTYTYTPANNDVVTCILVSNATCATGSPATSNPITMSVNENLPVGISITASENPVCQGTSVTFTATQTNGGSSPAYQWQVNGVNAGANNNTYSYTPINGDIITCIFTSNATCATGSPATSNPVAMTVNANLPVSINITASENPVCQGTSVTFTATQTNGGSSPAYQWQVNGLNAGTNNPSYTYTPANNDVVTCILTSNATCATGSPASSNPVTMIVNQNLPVEISITASENPICQGTSVTFTATQTNGGSSPAYQWQVNGVNAGANNPTYTYTPANNDIVTCILTSNATCATGSPATSNPFTIIVNPNLPVGISITASENPVCQGTIVTFTATQNNGGSSPAYQWQVNGVNAGANNPTYTYNPANNDVVTCILTSNATCATGSPATSNPLTIIVNPNLPVGISITASENPVCQGTSVTFTATQTNGGSSPAYQWQVNGVDAGANNPTYSYTPLNGDVVTCILTSNATCASGSPATSNPVTMIVNQNLPVGISITASENPVCQGTIVTFTATQTNGGSSPAYQWQVNGVNAGANNPTYMYTPANNDIVTCILTSNATCATGNPATSNPITMTINPNLPVSVYITASENPICQGISVTFTSTQTNGGSSPAYQWQVNGMNAGANNPTYSYTPINGDVVTCILASNATCATGSPATSNPVTMTINPNLPVSINITASENPVCQGTSVTFTSTQINGGSSPTYQWQVNGMNAGANNPTYSYTPLTGDIVACILTSNATCATGSPATSNPVTMVVNSNLPVGVSVTASENPVCQGTSVTFTATQTNGGSSPAYQWQVNGVNAGDNNPTYSYTPLNGDVVTCILTSNATCATGSPATSNPVTMIVNLNLPVGVSITASENPVCEGTHVTFTATPVNGGTSPVYHWKVNGINTGTSSQTLTYVPENNDVITCELISNAPCIMGNSVVISNEIYVTLYNLPSTSLNFCQTVVTRDSRPFNLRGGLPLGGLYLGEAVVGTTFDPALVPSTKTVTTLSYAYVNIHGCSDTSSQIITILQGNFSFQCGQSFFDVRDSQNYATVLIGTQCWMKQNLNVGHYINSAYNQADNCYAEKYCFLNDLTKCDIYGGLYQWNELMQYEILEPIQGLCPPGWHLPSAQDWEILVDDLYGSGNAGDSLKISGNSGFNSLFTGIQYQNSSWNFLDNGTFYWTSTSLSAIRSEARGLNIHNPSVSRYSSLLTNAFPTRCLKD